MRRVAWLAAAILALSGVAAAAANSSEIQGESSSREEAEAPPLSRAELWKSRRLEKLRRLVPDRPNRAERLLLFIEEGRLDEIFSIRYKDFYPRAGTITDGSGFGLGIRYFKSHIGGRRLNVESTYLHTFRDYRRLDFHAGRFDRIAPDFFVGPPEFGAPFRFGPPDPRDVDRKQWLAYAHFSYRYYPEEDFFGIGNFSHRDAESNFLIESFTSEVVLGRSWTPWLATAARVGWHQFNVEWREEKEHKARRGFSTDPREVPDLATQPDQVSAELALLVNATDFPGNPHRGVAVGLSAARFRGLGDAGSRADFSRYMLDARGYLPLLSPQRTLAVQVLAVRSVADSDRRIPFYLMPTLGGPNRLRGYESYRFRDNDFLYLSAEYRWEPAPAWELAFFYDTGRVFADGDWILEGFHHSIGFGTRFKTTRRTFLRIDYARGQEESRLHVRFGPAF
ncbi:MAG: hypothetical protein Kow00109_13580 [Acidobacteriota bacterium]